MPIRISVLSNLYAARVTTQHSPLHRRFQIALVLYRTKRKWQSRFALNLIAKYGAEEDKC